MLIRESQKGEIKYFLIYLLKIHHIIFLYGLELRFKCFHFQNNRKCLRFYSLYPRKRRVVSVPLMWLRAIIFVCLFSFHGLVLEQKAT